MRPSSNTRCRPDAFECGRPRASRCVRRRKTSTFVRPYWNFFPIFKNLLIHYRSKTESGKTSSPGLMCSCSDPQAVEAMITLTPEKFFHQLSDYGTFIYRFSRNYTGFFLPSICIPHRFARKLTFPGIMSCFLPCRAKRTTFTPSIIPKFED